MAITVDLALTVFGHKIGLKLDIDVANVVIDYTAVIALNRTRTCDIWGENMRSSATCAVWPISHQESAGVSGLNVTGLMINVSDFTFGMDVTGIGSLNKYIQQF